MVEQDYNIMEKRFNTPYTYHPEQFVNEVFTMPSETKPSKSLSLREIINRDLHGMLTPSGDVQPWYNEEFEVPDFKRMDLEEIRQYKEFLSEQKKEIDKMVSDEIAERKLQEAKAREQKEREKSEGDSKSPVEPAT